MGAGTSVGDGTAAPATWLPALTGLRFFAATAVYLSHLGTPPDAPAVLDSFLAAGHLGVTVFFVLSGFVLALNHFEQLRRPSVRSVWTYGVARVARIYPLYLLLLLFFVTSPQIDNGRGIWIEHLLGVQAWDGRMMVAMNYNAPAWSISVELFLYACFPLLVLALGPLRRSRTGILVLAGVLVTAMVAIAVWFTATGRAALPWIDPGSAHRWIYRMPLLRLGDFTLGILAAMLVPLVRHLPRVVGRARHASTAALLVMVAFMLIPALKGTAFAWDVLYAVPAIVLIGGLALAPTAPIGRVLIRPWIVRFGEASYAFYLCQWIWYRDIGIGGWKQGASPHPIVHDVLLFGALLALSIGLHQLVEQPARRAVRRVGARILAPPPLPLAVDGVPGAHVRPPTDGAPAPVPLDLDGELFDRPAGTEPATQRQRTR